MQVQVVRKMLIIGTKRCCQTSSIIFTTQFDIFYLETAATTSGNFPVFLSAFLL
jgi:hypothetical protein